jgi:DNA-binding transcriptional ArsR family regulator
MSETSILLLEPTSITSLKHTASIYRAINHKLRRQIIELLHKNKRLTVNAIYKKLKLDQSRTSQHLAILRSANILISEREGIFIFYSVNYNRLKSLHYQSECLLKEVPIN